MRLTTIPYAEAARRHPQEVEALVRRLRRGKSRHRQAPPESLTWGYCTAVQVNIGSVNRRVLSVDELVRDELSRTFTTLDARIGKWSGAERVPNPPELEPVVRERLEQQRRKDLEYEALPQAEKDRRARAAEQELLRMGLTKVTLNFLGVGPVR